MDNKPLVLVAYYDRNFVYPIIEELASLGFKVQFCENGAELFLAIRYKKPVALVINIQLAHGGEFGSDQILDFARTGVSVCQWLRKNGFHFPVVLITNGQDVSELESLPGPGVQKVLSMAEQKGNFSVAVGRTVRELLGYQGEFSRDGLG